MRISAVLSPSLSSLALISVSIMPPTTAAAATAAAATTTTTTVAAGANAGVFVAKHRGVSWVAGREIDADALEPVVDLGAEWISQTPFGWMKAVDEPRVGLVTDGHVLWGETDRGLTKTHRWAAEKRIKTALKPHIWVRGSWPGAVAMKTDADWKEFFSQYERFILHYARLAENNGVDLLVIGTELKLTTALREKEWRALIAKIRKTYHGPITYAANWDEVWHVPFWDALDGIGVNAYFPLLDAGVEVKSDRLIAAWRPVAGRLQSLAKEHDKKIVFTEIGYRATSDCAVRPWEHRGEGDSPRCQSVALDAMLQVFWDRDWFGGVYIWKWFPGDVSQRKRGLPAFSPQGRGGEKVIRRWFAPPAS